MKIEKCFESSCECGKIGILIKTFPKETPGRLKCYCDDCQSYLHYIKRADLLDDNGGTEVIPCYPINVHITRGKEFLDCIRLSPKGMYRFYSRCCKTPVANTDPVRAWVGFHRKMLDGKDASRINNLLGPVKSTIMGKFAKGIPPIGTPEKINLNGILTVMPFMLKGSLFKKAKSSPFFTEHKSSIVEPYILSVPEREAALKVAGFVNDILNA